MANYIAIGLVAWLVFSGHIFAQTFGPNSPSSGTNTTSIGTFSWTNPGNVVSSNNAYASVTSQGVTNYVAGTNFGFSVPVTTSINGIQLDVEKSTLSPTVVTLLDGWTSGLSKTVSAGTNRMLLLIYSGENSVLRDITSITYGGQPMTQIVEGSVVTSFAAKMEYWVLLNSGISSATSTAFVPTFAAGALSENVDYFASAVYQGVDQVLPFTSTQIFTATTAVTITASPTLAVTGGGMAVSAIHCGNNTTPNSTNGAATSYLVGGGFTETIDTYTSNPSASTTGICTEISNQSIASSGSVAPTYTFRGTPNRQIVIYCNLTCVRELDNSVRLIKGGVVTGNNLAYTITPWNTVDTYTSYGSSSNLWGTTWTVADVNATNFGAVLSASVNNGTARVDHMRITITGTSTLPVELLNFSGRYRNKRTELEWQTVSEHNNKHFIVERSSGKEDFTEIGRVEGRGTTKVFSGYVFNDPDAETGINYYRLKQVDYDGTFEYSKIISVTKNAFSDDDNEIVVYPNPTTDGNFKIAAQQVIFDGVYIYSTEMKLIKRVNTNAQKELEVSITELSDGVYYLLFSTGGKQTIKKLEKFCR